MGDKTKQSKTRNADQEAVGIAYLDLDGRILEANPQFCVLTGYSQEELTGLDFHALAGQEDKETVASNLQQVAAGEMESTAIQTCCQRKDGTALWALIIASLPRTGAASGDGILAILQDISSLKQREAVLEEYLIRTRLAISATRIGTWDWNLEEQSVVFSPEWKRQLGYEDAELPSEFNEWENRLHPEDRDRILKNLEDYLGGKSDEYQVEFRLRHKNGTYRWIYARAEKQVDTSGRVIRLYGCHMDITDRKKAKDELLYSEEKLRRLVQQSPVGIQIHDLEGRFIDTNNAFVRLYGLDPEAIPELYEKYNLHQDEQLQRLGMGEGIKQVYSGKEVLFPVFRYDGVDTLKSIKMVNPVSRTCWVRARGYPLKDDQGRVTGAVFLSEDITEQQKAAEDLRASEEKFRAIMEQAPLAIQIVNPEGRIENVNKAWQNLWGVQDEQLADLLESYNLFEDKELAERGVLEFVDRLFNGERVFLPLIEYDATQTAAELGMDQIQAHKRWVRFSGYPVKDSQGKVVNIVNVEEDVTESIEAQKRFEAQQQRLHALTAEVANKEEQERRRIANDLHDGAAQSLAFARMELATVMKSIPDEEAVEKMDNISQLLRKSIRQIREVLLHLTTPALNEIGLAAAISEWMEIQIGRHNGMQFVVTDKTGAISLSAEIRTILFRNTRELLMNVIKHAAATLITVSLSVSQGNLLITVEDNGVGFNPQQKVESTGFGISSVQENMKSIGGSFQLETQPGSGTRVTLRLALQLNEGVN
jgi:PAS domain S-box-containing protein